MADKKEYIQVLTALDRIGPLSAALNQLSEVQMATEDAKLRSALEAVCSSIRGQNRELSAKLRLMDDFSYLGVAEGSLHAGIGKIAAYCSKQRDASMQQWEILARRAGWKPPTS
ncbi:hypothetical protein BJG93_34420 (plasmid) [Paraburkholderia sprentiae WSM5005]|uniref:Uncharacterized protein n=1 Tax=Paraburkholderia sprentiae WSM5005 TaxID=754502 RepID=A0A1I9YVJ3_9BURK|nr:hypothetical protein [Paraburkholderia sprentiae]APA90214.1 hypothetical protein BJG93_34420 [Paraburkholderia sprentiae WSM5005]